MSSVGTRRIVWQGGEHQCCLAVIGSLLALEESCKASLATIYGRLGSQSWGLNDIRETIRCGLVGGGMSDERAAHLVRRFVDGNPNGLADGVQPAMTAIEAVLVGVPNDPLGVQGGTDPDVVKKRPELFADDGRLRRSILLGLGAGLGWSPAVTYAATIWEIAACVEGHNRANGADDQMKAPSNDEFDEMLKKHNIHATVQ